MRTNSRISDAWLRAPDELDRHSLLEYTRSALYSLSFTADASGDRLRPVHVARLRNAFNDLGAPSLHRVGLRLLTLLGEVEALFGGYWLMAPFRVLTICSRSAFVGAIPLASGFSAQISQQGLARYLTEESAARFPKQDIEGWMGITTSSSEYIQHFTKSHRKHAKPALHSAGIEYLTLVMQGAQPKRGTWSREPSAICSGERLAVCRQSDQGIYRYFSAELSDKKTIANEAGLRHSVPRLTFAFASDAGTPFRIASRLVGKSLEVEVPERLPTEEFRLSLLLSRVIARRGSATTFSIDAELAPLFLKKLQYLGCQLESAS